jgi:hypothetical protein
VSEQQLSNDARAHNGGASRKELAQTEDVEEMIMHLERDQLVAETFHPVARAELAPRLTAALWALRIFVVLVSVMVIYAFVQRLS